jgi:hypothetical protein
MGYISGGVPVKHTAGMNEVATLDLTMAPIAGNAVRLGLRLIAAAILALNFF